MPVTRLNPDTLYESVRYGFSHAALQEGGRTLHLAGQVGWDQDYQVAAGDLAAQARQALSNLRLVLEAAGATPDDVVRLRTYVVDHSPDKLGVFVPAISEFFGGKTPAPNTVVGVSALALPEFLIEFEATAALKD